MKATTPQLTKIHLLITELNLLADKKEIVKQYTNGRAISSKDMTFNEAKALIAAMTGKGLVYDPFQTMRRKVFALAYEAGFIMGDSQEDKLMNSAKLNKWLQEKGAVKKPLNKMDKSELIKTLNQFEMIVKHKKEGAVNAGITDMLSGLGITTNKTGKANSKTH